MINGWVYFNKSGQGRERKNVNLYNNLKNIQVFYRSPPFFKEIQSVS